MTIDVAPDTEALLVATARVPDVPPSPRVSVSPGPLAVRDADTYRARIVVGFAGARSSIRQTAIGEVLEVVREWLRMAEATGVRFGDRSVLAERLHHDALDRLERRLLACAREAGTLLVTWTGGRPDGDDADRYDEVRDLRGDADRSRDGHGSA